jgi:glycosyltransferase involved in cell wall biosynthesis
MRDLARRLSELNPLLRLTARRATIGLATTPKTAWRLRAVGCRNISVLSQVALTGDEISRLSSFPLRHNKPFRPISVGSLVHLKGFDLGLRAFASFQHRYPAAEYWIIGDGPERGRLERLARELRIADKVVFTGALLRQTVLERLAECDVLLHPALHDSGGCVSLEAMAAGRPVICLDLGGPAFQVTDETGIKVPANSPPQAVSDLAAAMLRLAQYPALRLRLGQAGRRRVAAQFDWDQKGIFMANLYEALKKNEID